MKNIQNWKKFNESYNQEMINEGLIGDLIKLPFKIIGFLLKPLVPLLLKIIGKSISIENKWKITKAILDNVAKLALDVEEAKKKLAKEGSDLTPNERRELEKKVEKFKKSYPNGFKFSEVKKKLVESVEENFAKATDEKKKEASSFRKKTETQSTSRVRIDKNRRGQRDVFVPVKMRGDISRFEQIDEH